MRSDFQLSTGAGAPAASPGGVLPQGIKIAMISGGDHTTIYRWAGEAGSEEERRYLKNGKKYEKVRYLKIFARIPLQSPPEGGDSFPPGEAVSSCVEVYRAASILSASWRMRVEIQAVSMIRRTCSIRCRAPGTGSR